MTRRGLPTALIALALAACAGARSQTSIDEETAGFYEAFEAEIREAVRDLGPDGRDQLLNIMPAAEVEGATDDVLEVIETRPPLRPFVRRIRRFLQNEPSNWVRRQLATESGDRRLWHVLLDSINGELGRPST